MSNDQEVSGLNPTLASHVVVSLGKTFNLPCLQCWHHWSVSVSGDGPGVSKSRMKGRAFSFQAPLLWNQLPTFICDADTLSIFKTRLKTFLFNKSYTWEFKFLPSSL